MRTNKTTIELTFVKEGLRKEFFETCLGLRTAKKISDKETVNNTVLGKLERYESYISFKKLPF